MKNAKAELIEYRDQIYILYPVKLDFAKIKVKEAYQELWGKEIIEYDNNDFSKPITPIVRKEKNLNKGLKNAVKNSALGIGGFFALQLFFGFTGSIITFLMSSWLPLSAITAIISHITITNSISGKQKDYAIELLKRKCITFIRVHDKLKGEELVRYLNGQ